MLTKFELEFCVRVANELKRIAEAIAKLYGVSTSAPKKDKTPVQLEPPVRDELPKRSRYFQSTIQPARIWSLDSQR